MAFWDGITGTEEAAFSRALTPIPAGTKVFAEIKECKVSGANIKFNWQVCEGDYKNRYVSDFLSVDNPNEFVRERSRNTLMYIYNMFGVQLPSDMPEQHELNAFEGRKAELVLGERAYEKDGAVHKVNTIKSIHSTSGMIASGVATISSASGASMASSFAEDVPF